MRRALFVFVLGLISAITCAALPRQPSLDPLLTETRASAVLLDAASGRTLKNFGPAVTRAVAPGSTLKPFLLLAALAAGTVQERTSVECRGTLTVDDHGHPRNLTCTHPRSLIVFAARDALAYSCNSYFARLAETTPEPALERGLHDFGLHATISGASPASRVLFALGLRGIEVTPAQLARAYRLLALRFAAIRSPHEPLAIVRDGLLDGVRFGMANNAAVPGLEIAGKTGTASEPGEPWTHGWFAGIVSGPASTPERILVVFVPRGSGAEAAGIARQILAGLPR